MTEPDPELFAALRAVLAAFEKHAVPYYIVGSVASGVFGEPRQTLDADLVAALWGRHVPVVAEMLAPEFYVDQPMMFRAIEHQSSFNLIHLQTMVKVDVYVAWRSDFARSQFARRIRADLSARAPLWAYLASPEDTVLSKLVWYRQGGGVSDRQWRDVLGVLKVQGESLDRGYLEDWAGRLQVAELLRRAFDDAGLWPAAP